MIAPQRQAADFLSVGVLLAGKKSPFWAAGAETAGWGL
jgi:hypothetical protein